MPGHAVRTGIPARAPRSRDDKGTSPLRGRFPDDLFERRDPLHDLHPAVHAQGEHPFVHGGEEPLSREGWFELAHRQSAGTEILIEMKIVLNALRQTCKGCRPLPQLI